MSAIAQIGDNSAAVPLAVQLTEETQDLQKRSADLLAGFAKVPAEIADDETAGKVALIGKQIADQIKKTDEARKKRKEPFLENGRTVDAHFGGMIDALTKAKASLATLMAKYLAKAKREGEERQRQEQEKARAAQIQAEKAAALAALDGDPNAVESAQEQAAEAETRMQAAAQPVHVVADSGYGAKAHTRKVPVVTITNIAAACMWLIKNERAAVNEFVVTVYGKRARGGARGTELPGATVTEEDAASFR